MGVIKEISNYLIVFIIYIAVWLLVLNIISGFTKDKSIKKVIASVVLGIFSALISTDLIFMIPQYFFDKSRLLYPYLTCIISPISFIRMFLVFIPRTIFLFWILEILINGIILYFLNKFFKDLRISNFWQALWASFMFFLIKTLFGLTVIWPFVKWRIT